MSTFASLTCNDHKHLIDVAYSYATDEVRLWIDDEEDDQETTTYLTVERAEHVIELMQLAVNKIRDSYGN